MRKIFAHCFLDENQKKYLEENFFVNVHNANDKILSSDELIGGFDEIKGKKIRIDGYLEEFSLSRKEADQLIMSAREIVYK